MAAITRRYRLVADHAGVRAMLKARPAAIPAVRAEEFASPDRSPAAAQAMAMYCQHWSERFLAAYPFDPQRHASTKALVREHQTGELRAQHAVAVERMLDDLLAGASPGAPFSVRQVVAMPLAARLACHLLGVDLPETEVLAALETGRDALLPDTDGPRRLVGWRALAPLTRTITEAVADCAYHPDGLLAKLAQAERAQGLTRDFTVASAVVLVLGGVSLAEALRLGLARALADAQIGDVLAGSEAASSTAIDELLRLHPPNTSIRRFAPEDSTPYEHVFDAASVSAANRDPTRFPQADRFLADRAHNPHLSFGFAPHMCDGASISRTALRHALHTILTRMRGLRLAGAADDKDLIVIFDALE